MYRKFLEYQPGRIQFFSCLIPNNKFYKKLMVELHFRQCTEDANH